MRTLGLFIALILGCLVGKMLAYYEREIKREVIEWWNNVVIEYNMYKR